MNYFIQKLIRPSTLLLCSSLVLLLILLLNASTVDAGGGGGGGKKKIVPVKQIFGVGIGYQKVTHYKPVLVFSRHRRMKQRKRRRPGRGWKKGWKQYAPIHVQHHVQHSPMKHGRSGPHHRHGGGGGDREHHPKAPPPPMYDHSSEGWGWRPRGSRHPPPPPPPSHKGRHHMRGHRHKYRGQSQSGSGYDYHIEGSSHPIQGGGDDYVDEYDGHHGPSHSNYRRNPSSNYYYGNPYAGPANFDEDHGGYESEIKNHILSPLVFPTSDGPTPTTNPPPPIYPFTEPPKSDASVTNIHRDFLRNHLKNFHQFQEYQRSTSKEDHNNDHPHHNHNGPHEPSNSQVNPMILNPPGPNYSTMDLMNSDSVKVEDADVQYPQYDDPPNADDYYSTENWPGAGSGSDGPKNHFDTEEIESSPGWNKWNEVNKKIMPVTSAASTTTPNPLIPPPPVIVGVPSPNHQNGNSNNNNFSNNHNNRNVMYQRNTNRLIMSTTPMPKTKFKASPRVDDVGSGNKFSNPGFFPSFDQFKKIKMK